MENLSPAQTGEVVSTMAFGKAIEMLSIGRKITRKEWANLDDYCLLKGEILMIHKKGEPQDVLHQWVVSLGDIQGEDWFVIS